MKVAIIDRILILGEFFALPIFLTAMVAACAAGLTEEDKKFRDEYIVDEQACVAKRKAGAISSAEAFDCVCKVMARRGKDCGLDGGK